MTVRIINYSGLYMKLIQVLILRLTPKAAWSLKRGLKMRATWVSDILGVRSMFVSRREPSKRPTRLKGNIGALNRVFGSFAV